MTMARNPWHAAPLHCGYGKAKPVPFLLMSGLTLARNVRNEPNPGSRLVRRCRSPGLSVRGADLSRCHCNDKKDRLRFPKDVIANGKSASIAAFLDLAPLATTNENRQWIEAVTTAGMITWSVPLVVEGERPWGAADQ